MLVPLVNLIAIYIVAFSTWPALARLSGSSAPSV